MSEPIPATLGEQEELRRLSVLLEVSQTLTDTLHLEQSLSRVVRILSRHRQVLQVGVVLPDEEEPLEISSPSTEAAVQLRSRAVRDLLHSVLKSGKPFVIPRVSRESQIPKTARGRWLLEKRDHSFLCVPVFAKDRVIGAVQVELLYSSRRDYERALKFFSLAASMVGQAVRIHRLVEAEKRKLLEENLHLREELKERYDFSNIVGNSNPMREVYEKVTQVARTDTTVLIRGESGTGKELIAHAIHYNSLRAGKPFVRVSCAALPETLIESELFGYEAGAFTGAERRKIGRFELAEGGTLFLDEVGELQPAIQVKLLRVLQEKEFERLGGHRTIRVNVRLIAATNKDLEKAIAAGQFREDLYYRLNVFTIFMPPLRDRKSDILLLAEHFLEKYSARHGKGIRRISTPAIDMLASYHWPGNVRELENAMERAVLVCDGPVIHSHHLPPTLQTAEASNTQLTQSLEQAVGAYEKDLIQDALKSARGNRAQAARLLQTTPRILRYKVRKYGIDWRRFR